MAGVLPLSFATRENEEPFIPLQEDVLSERPEVRNLVALGFFAPGCGNHLGRFLSMRAVALPMAAVWGNISTRLFTSILPAYGSYLFILNVAIEALTRPILEKLKILDEYSDTFWHINACHIPALGIAKVCLGLPIISGIKIMLASYVLGLAICALFGLAALIYWIGKKILSAVRPAAVPMHRHV